MSLPSPAIARRSWFPNRERTRFWLGKIGHFGAWQLASQGLQLITGFLLVRWLSIEAYAQYGVALSFQNMLNLLVDLGFSSSIIALVGDRIHDREIVGRHIRAARSFRNTMLLTIGPLSAVGFFWLARTHHWPLAGTLLLFSSILGFLFFQGWTACYTPPLLMHLQITRLYRPGVLLNAAKLLTCTALHLLAALGAAAVCWLNALAAMATALLYRSSARPFLTEPPSPDPETSRAIRKYSAPLIPGMVFYAFQGQIQVFLISFFGKTQSIAEVAALGRLGQLFMFLSAFNVTIVAPFIARVPVARLGVRYSQAILLSATAGISLSAAAFLFPEPFLWLLGSKYAGLRTEVGLSVSVSSLCLLNTVFYQLNSARQWVYHWTNFVNIPLLIGTQLVCLVSMNLSTTLNVMLFSLITSTAQLVPQFATAIYGYRKRAHEL